MCVATMIDDDAATHDCTSAASSMHWQSPDVRRSNLFPSPRPPSPPTTVTHVLPRNPRSTTMMNTAHHLALSPPPSPQVPAVLDQRCGHVSIHRLYRTPAVLTLVRSCSLASVGPLRMHASCKHSPSANSPTCAGGTIVTPSRQMLLHIPIPSADPVCGRSIAYPHAASVSHPHRDHVSHDPSLTQPPQISRSGTSHPLVTRVKRVQGLGELPPRHRARESRDIW
nr:hypothetical protein CFP56_63494 [Quercus suber]